MRIDFSTIALIVSLVVPGLAVKKSRRKIGAPFFESLGPATELGELVALSLSVHLALLALFSVAALFLGIAHQHSAASYFQAVDRFNYPAWSDAHRSEAVLAVAFYICLSIVTGYLQGILSGWLKLNHPFLHIIAARPGLTSFARRMGIFSLIEERPISFDLFTGEAVSRKTELIYFLELRLRDEKGFVTGELLKYAVVKDEEAQRLVVLGDARFKLVAEDEYEIMDGDRLLIDLADALLVQVSYREREAATQDLEE